jgi:hypothetical protein
MVWVAAVNEEVVKLATPELSSGMALPITVEPSLKLTVPVGVPAPPVTVAVNVTDCPKAEGFWEELRLVAEGLAAVAVIAPLMRSRTVVVATKSFLITLFPLANDNAKCYVTHYALFMPGKEGRACRGYPNHTEGFGAGRGWGTGGVPTAAG